MKSAFYSLSRAQNKNEIILAPIDKYDETNLKIGECEVKEPLLVKVDKGKIFYDFLFYSDPFNFAVSERVLSLFSTNKLSGYSFYKISIQKFNNPYFGFQIIGKCGEIHRPSKGWLKGYRFDLNSWDGSDFFCPSGTLHVFITEKVKNLLEENLVSNVKCNPLAEIDWFNSR